MNKAGIVLLGIQLIALGGQLILLHKARGNWKLSKKKLQEADEVVNAVKKLALMVDRFNTGQLLSFPTGQHGKNIN